MLCGAVLLAGLPAADAAQVCASHEEKMALDARVLQSELVVGAIACKEAERYNRFVNRFRPVLSTSGQKLKDYFRRADGGQAEASLNDLVTTLANQASRRRLDWGDQYCGFVSALLDHALTIEPSDYAAYVAIQPYAETHGIERCTR